MFSSREIMTVSAPSTLPHPYRAQVDKAKEETAKGTIL